MLVSKEFTFDAAHFLTKYKGKCENLHGHTYRLRITVEGPIGEDDMVMDFVVLKKLVNEKIVDKMDHVNLNDLFENPTAERMAEWIWEQLEDAPEFDGAGVLHLYEVKLWEGLGSFVTYRGE
jgi:6-pyruvoyltetrahydropterin/6-carboxytetrahydropterin synthase